MRKILIFILLCGFISGCSKDGDGGPVFVTGIEMPPATQLFAPGDEVAIKAKGFEAGDEIVLRITWPVTDGPFSEGVADFVRSPVTLQSPTGITFLVPGGYPAGEAEVKLFRQGGLMPLGTISVSDGLPPEEYSLYGITNHDLISQTNIERIDMTSGAVTPLNTFGPTSGFTCPVNAPGTNRIEALSRDGLSERYDLTMRYYSRWAGNRFVAIGYYQSGTGSHYSNSVSHLSARGNTIFLHANETRANIIPMSYWPLPEGITPEMLSDHPFVVSGGLLLAAHTAERRFVPFVCHLHEPVVLAADAVEADDLIPFLVARPYLDKSYLAGGYAVVKEGTTEFRMFDPMTGTFGETLTTVPAPVLSVQLLPTGLDTQRIYMLCDEGGSGKRIRVYDVKADALTMLPGTVRCSEIVLAR